MATASMRRRVRQVGGSASVIGMRRPRVSAVTRAKRCRNAAGPAIRYASRMILQGILFAIGWLTLGVVLLFFATGLTDGTVSPVNIPHWAGLIAVPAVILWGATVLRAKGHGGAAMVLLGLLAVPALLAGAVILVFIVAPPRWN
jgi:hypothetical protein